MATEDLLNFVLDEDTFKAIRKICEIYAQEFADKVKDPNKLIEVKAVYPPFRENEGAFKVGDIRKDIDKRLYKCRQAYDPAVNPGITLQNGVFWIPLHGTTPETAVAFIPVTGAHDMYKAGEYTIFEGNIYKCISDTNFSPTEYPNAWELYVPAA